VGIVLGIFFATPLIFLTILLAYHRHHRQQAQIQDTLNDIGTFIGGHKPSTLQRQATNSTTSDGRRTGTVIGDDEYYVSPLSGISEEDEDRRNRDTIDAWKKGYVPPLSPDDVAVPIEVGNGQMRRGTLAGVGHVPLNSPDDGLGTLGLSYVNSRLAELEGSEGRFGDLDSQVSGKEAPSIKSRDSVKSWEGAMTNSGRSEPGEGVGKGETAHKSGNEALPTLGKSSEGIGYGPSKQVMGREGVEQLAWWEKPGLD
jgi:hypothetical protein